MVNSEDFEIEKITVKYLEPGHTFMSADSVHGLIEKEMNRVGNVEDFPGFSRCIARCSTGGKVVPVEMGYSDFLKFDNGFRSVDRNKPLLKNIAVVEFRKNHQQMYYKGSFEDFEDEDEEWDEFGGLKRSFSPFDLPQSCAGNNGITKTQYDSIVKDLVPLMAADSRPFWRKIDVNEDRVPLCDITE